MDFLASVFRTFQRLADLPALFDADAFWMNVVLAGAAEHLEAWQKIRTEISASQLLSSAELIRLLKESPGLWEGAAKETDFQQSIGWLVRQVNEEKLSLNNEATLLLEKWLIQCCEVAEESNYVLTQGLRFAPHTVKKYALAWLHAHPLKFQTHFLLSAWLKHNELEANEEILALAQAWVERLFFVKEASFFTCPVIGV